MTSRREQSELDRRAWEERTAEAAREAEPEMMARYARLAIEQGFRRFSRGADNPTWEPGDELGGTLDEDEAAEGAA